MDIKEFEYTVMKLKPKDILVLKTQFRIPEKDFLSLKKIVPDGVEIVMITDDVELSVISGDDNGQD